MAVRNLKDGSKLRMLIMCEELGAPITRTFSARDFAHYRANRKTKGRGETRNGTEMAASSHNYDQLWLQSVFNYQIDVKEYRLPNPMKGLKKSSWLRMSCLT